MSKQEEAESDVEKNAKSRRLLEIPCGEEYSAASQRYDAFNYPHEMSILGFKSSQLKIKQELPEEILAEDCQTESGEFLVDKSSTSQRHASELADKERKGLFCEAKNNLDNPELLTLGAGLPVIGGASSGQDYTTSARGFVSSTKGLSRFLSASTADCTFINSSSSSYSESNPSFSCSGSLNNESDSTNGRFVESDFTCTGGRPANISGGASNDRGDSSKSSFEDKEILAEDIATTEKEEISSFKSLQCETCGKLFGFSRNLSVHKRIHTGERPFECCICDKTFSDQSNYRRHIKNHKGLKTHHCDICNQSYTRLTSLKRHNARAHERRKEVSTISQKKITQEAADSVTHTWERPVTSDSTCVCGKEFGDARSLQRHRTTHMEKSHVCNTCNRRFHHEDCLKSHAKHHLLVKPFNCDECGKGFTERRFLTRHRKIHSGIKPHVCDHCGMGFVRACSLKIHERIHLDKVDS